MPEKGKKKKAKKEKKEIKIKLPKFRIPKDSPWFTTTVILILVTFVTAFFFFRNCSMTGKTIQTLSKEVAGDKAVNYINDNLIQKGSVSLDSVKKMGGIYRVTTLYQDQQIPVYITKDGSYLFVGNVYNLSEGLAEEKSDQDQNNQEQEFDAPNKEKATAMLFVMSFCPYGQQAENAMKPVVDLLGNKSNIEPHFIVNVDGDTVNSLHGEYEATEDMRQACIWKEYGQSTFWEYVDYINNNCNKNNLDSCWKDAAEVANVNTTKIGNCVETEGTDLMKNEENLANKYDATGSPTLIINDQRYSGSRTPEAFKQAICSGFITEPEECSQQLTGNTGGSPSGGC